MSQLGWRKSSFSTGAENDCVEIAAAPGGLIRLRESDDPAQIITTDPVALAGLLRTIKADRLTPPVAPRT
ncbi:hypothetical protein AF335_27835 [Streptomyces eurocidicus]|uniref:DUF397 domain-containing protein n=1 Tax=Streptomyces eurocidicus TaxID=66423 RepID=A0A2N8NPC4_STREU|nr:DUF397 domain-containing protein [Streptomyces eurocidicus]MBB5119670.1 hypothetical protein [Streptomyces eurocidicus]MBF6050697.1 DUF397 domain-containing protein [Streptomyces eurocidicus]PNE30621.1 hypothetical protein AF335_27835 [Streptomyces eurocidicus]